MTYTLIEEVEAVERAWTAFAGRLSEEEQERYWKLEEEGKRLHAFFEDGGSLEIPDDSLEAWLGAGESDPRARVRAIFEARAAEKRAREDAVL